jgi:hypothetical protein
MKFHDIIDKERVDSIMKIVCGKSTKFKILKCCFDNFLTLLELNNLVGNWGVYDLL